MKTINKTKPVKANEKTFDEMEAAEPEQCCEYPITKLSVEYLEALVKLQDNQIKMLNKLIDTMERLSAIDEKHIRRLEDKVALLTEQLTNKETLNL